MFDSAVTLSTPSILVLIFDMPSVRGVLDPAGEGTGGACRCRNVIFVFSSSTRTTIQTPIWPLLPSSGVQWIHLLRPSKSDLEIQRTFAVTPRPSAIAAVSSSRTRSEPPILLRKGDCRIPGTRWEGDAKRMRRWGEGRTRRYYTESVGHHQTIRRVGAAIHADILLRIAHS